MATVKNEKYVASDSTNIKVEIGEKEEREWDWVRNCWKTKKDKKPTPWDMRFSS